MDQRAESNSINNCNASFYFLEDIATFIQCQCFLNNSERPIDALPVKNVNYSLTHSLKSRDASATKKNCKIGVWGIPNHPSLVEHLLMLKIKSFVLSKHKSWQVVLFCVECCGYPERLKARHNLSPPHIAAPRPLVKGRPMQMESELT